MIGKIKIYNDSFNDIVLQKEMPDFIKFNNSVMLGESEIVRQFGKYCPAYIRTTENIKGYFKLLNLKDKSVLTVIGSSDQIFEAVLKDASRVDGFDSSMYAAMFFYLKEAAIKSLSYEEYLNFFFVERECFKYNVFQKIKENLNKDAYEFWNNIFEKNKNFSSYLITSFLVDSQLYGHYSVAESKLSMLSSVYSEDRYYELREKLSKCEINIYLCDVNELDRIKDMYDYIILSNIFQYQKGEALDRFKASIERYRDKLNDNGEIIVGYVYDSVDTYNYNEYKFIDVPTAITTALGAPDDKIMVTGKNK